MTHSKITQCPGTPVFMPPEALRAKPRYSDKLDTFSAGVLIIQIITRTFPAPTDAEIVVEDPSSPFGEKVIPVLELERRKKDIDKVPSDHSLLPIACHCIKNISKERPTAAQLCRSLEQLKAAHAGLRRQQSCREPAEQSLPPAAAEAEGRRECGGDCSTAGADEAATERARVEGERECRVTTSAAVCTDISSSSATEDHCSCQESLKTIMLLYTLCAIMHVHVHVHTLSCSKHNVM